MDIASRRNSFKRTVDASDASAARKRCTQDMRQKLKDEAAKQRRFATTAALPDVSNTLFQAAPSHLEVFKGWKEELQRTDVSSSQVDSIRTQCLELISRVVVLDAISIQAFLQVLLLVAQGCNGTQLLPFFPVMLAGIRDGNGDTVRSSALFLTTALENDTEDNAVNTFMWEFHEDPIGVLMSVLPSQRPDVQSVIMMCIKTACAVRNLMRVHKLAPFLVSLLHTSPALAMECVSELAMNATLEEMQALRECGLLTFCIQLVHYARQDQAEAIHEALVVFDAFAEFCQQTDAPSIWLITDGALSALSALVYAEWYEDEYADMTARITANIAVTCVEAVLAQTRLCTSIVSYLFDESLDLTTYEEVLALILNLVKMPGLDAVRVQSLADMGAIDGLVHALQNITNGNTVLTSDVLLCLRDCLSVSPTHANDVADLGGVQVLMDMVLRSEGHIQALCMALLRDHFPSVFQTST